MRKIRPLILFYALLSPSLLPAKTLGLLPFKGKGIDEKMKESIRSLVTSEIDILGIYEVFIVDEKETGKIPSGCYSSTPCLKERGETAGMDYLIIGGVGRKGNRISLKIRFFNVREGRIIRSTEQVLSGEPEEMAMEIPDLVSRFFPKGEKAEDLVTPFGEVGTDIPPPPPIEPEPVSEKVEKPPPAGKELDVLGLFEEGEKDEKKGAVPEIEEKGPEERVEDTGVAATFEDMDMTDAEREKMRREEEKRKRKEAKRKRKEEKRRLKEAKKREKEERKRLKRLAKEKAREEERRRREAEELARAKALPEPEEELISSETAPPAKTKGEELPEIQWKSSISEIRIENVDEVGEEPPAPPEVSKYEPPEKEEMPPPPSIEEEDAFIPPPPAEENRYSYEVVMPSGEEESITTTAPRPGGEELDIDALLREEKKKEEPEKTEYYSYEGAREAEKKDYDHDTDEVKIIRGWKEEKNLVSLVMKGGYSFYYYHMLNFAGEFNFFPMKEVALCIGGEGMNGYSKEDDEGTWFYVIPFNVGVKYIKTGKPVQPFLGADLLMIAYDSAFNLSFGLRAVGGVNYLFTRYFGLHAGVNLGFAYGPKIEDLGDYSEMGFLFQTIVGTILSF